MVPNARQMTRVAKLLPRGARQRLRVAPRQMIGQLRHRGDQLQCPCCGSQYQEFASFRGRDRACWHCGSLERDRLLSLFFDLSPHLLQPGMSILHVAPEAPLRPRLERLAGEYISGDLTGTFGDRIIDVTRLRFPDESFDAVVCNHVLEHIPDDRAAMRELRRVLRRTGWAILLVPDVESEDTIEDPSVTDPAEQLRLFGQEDHVRRYGFDYLDRLATAGFTPEAIDLRQQLSPEAIARHRLEKFGAVERIFLCR
jgi:SAM-dependent methyltransferase